MQLTSDYRDVLPSTVIDRYDIREVRNAARVLRATDPDAFAEIVDALERFRLTAAHLLLPGGNEGLVAKQLNLAMRRSGWREARVDTEVRHSLVKFPFSGAKPPEKKPWVTLLEPQSWEGYKADWVKGRIAGDCEWNAKDGNLDRDFASYRSLYEAGFIDGAVLVTRTQEDLITLETGLIEELMTVGAQRASEVTGYPAKGFLQSVKRIEEIRAKPEKAAKESRLGTSTTTNLDKLVQRLTRGDGGGCPVLVVAICGRTFDQVRLSGPVPSTPTPALVPRDALDLEEPEQEEESEGD